MSRLEFRAAVAAPRPAAAWVMSAVGAACLWITGQLALPLMAIQGAAIVVSFWLRRAPRPIQQNAIALNVGMFAIVAVTIRASLETQSSVIALAHFTALTQGLQLLDARPRKSEFLLVALALFQVILAANLTDSVFFPILLLVFTFATTWTLIIHTLRTEAIEAHEKDAARAAITPGLLRTTLVASGLSIALALVLFVMLPRMRSSMIHGNLSRSPMALSGFSDDVELGTIGRIRQDQRVALRVETLSGEAPPLAQAYWRGLAFDSFDGRRWKVDSPIRTAIAGSPKFGLALGLGVKKTPLVQRIVREPVEAGVLFAMGEARSLRGALFRVETDANGGLYGPGQSGQRIRYEVGSDVHQATDAQLREDAAEAPLRRGQRYLELPAFDPRVGELARKITRGIDNDAERVRALESHLRRRGRYTDTPPRIDEAQGLSPVESFLLGDLAGHCEYFASGLVVLVRSLGLPARLVNGFAGGRRNPLGGFVEVTHADAHAWVEVHYRENGWVRYDATPPDLRLRADEALGFLGMAAGLGSALELWWFQRVVDFDTSDQIAALRSAWGSWRELESSARNVADPLPEGRSRRSLGPLPVRDMAGGAAVAVLGFVLWRQRRRSSSASAGVSVPEGYERALRILKRRGLRRGESQTAREFMLEVQLQIADPGASAFARLTEAYLDTRFGGQPDASSRRDLETLREAVAASPS